MFFVLVRTQEIQVCRAAHGHLRVHVTCTNKRSKMPKFQSGENNMYRKLFSQLLLTSSNSFDVVFFSVRNKSISSLLLKKRKLFLRSL